MAVYKTDRQRRILGDRMVARGAELSGIHPAVAEVHGLFADAHDQLKSALEERRREEGESSLARERREEVTEKCARMYSWAYHRVENLIAPTWETETAGVDPESVRERLFPLGTPTTVGSTDQMILDGLTHFLAAAERETVVSYPVDFLMAAETARDELIGAFREVTREDDETKGAAKTVAEARDRWDTRLNALRDVTSCFLRLRGDLSRLDVLFRALPDSSGADKETPATPTPQA